MNNPLVTGPAFKIINADTGELITAFTTLTEAQIFADDAHTNSVHGHHFQIYEVVWCGGSKRLADIAR